jgi:hypothetical protein
LRLADKVAFDPSGKSGTHRIIAKIIRPAPKPAAGFLIGEAFVAKAVLFYRNLSGAFSSNLTRRAILAPVVAGKILICRGSNPTSEELFDKLTGARSPTLPDGTRVGPNGVRLRPDAGDGARIDIPANGGKKHETIHFPGSPKP